MYYIETRFTRIRNRQYRQLRRLRCETLIHSVFALPQPLLSASFLHDLLLQRCQVSRQVMNQRGSVDSESNMSSPFRKGYSPLNGDPKQYHGWMTLQRSLMYEDGLGKVMSGLETAPAAPEEDATQVQEAQICEGESPL